MSREEVDAQIETDFSRLEELPPVKVKLPSPPPPPKRDRKPADMHSELKMAAAICVKSKEAVVSMFNEARMGRAVDSAGAQNLVEEISDSVTRNPGARLARLRRRDVPAGAAGQHGQQHRCCQLAQFFHGYPPDMRENPIMRREKSARQDTDGLFSDILARLVGSIGQYFNHRSSRWIGFRLCAPHVKGLS